MHIAVALVFGIINAVKAPVSVWLSSNEGCGMSDYDKQIKLNDEMSNHTLKHCGAAK